MHAKLRIEVKKEKLTFLSLNKQEEESKDWLQHKTVLSFLPF